MNRSLSAKALALLLLPAACGGEDPGAGAGAPAAAAFELRDVVAPARAALERELGLPQEPIAAADDALYQRVRGLASLLNGPDRSLRSVALEEVAGIGDGALAALERLITAQGRTDAEAAAGLELLAAVDTRAAGELLLRLLVEGEPSWIRAHSAWRLGSTTQQWTVPRMILRLKYEKDHDTVIWIAQALAHFGNFSGLEALWNVAASSTEDVLRESANVRLAEIAAAAGFEAADELIQAWRTGDPDERLEEPERSRAFELEVWSLIGRFREFQLRGVDDSRFVLERLDATAARILALALHDGDLYTRVHSAQSLARMGPRARPAGDELIAALAEPGLAPEAATALGAIAYGPAEPVLLARIHAGVDPELRIASLRALGGAFGPFDAASATLAGLRAAAESGEPAELRQAAVESLISRGAATEFVSVALELLEDARLEPASTERVLRTWLVERASTEAASAERAAEVLQRWDELGETKTLLVPTEERRAMVSRRVALLRESLGDLL